MTHDEKRDVTFFRERRVRPKTRSVPGQMNRTEEAYMKRLKVLQDIGEIVTFRFEGVKLRLAARTFYTPDFFVVTDKQIELHEVKGHWEEDARVKIKVAAELYPEFAFFAVHKVRDGWEIEEF